MWKIIYRSVENIQVWGYKKKRKESNSLKIISKNCSNLPWIYLWIQVVSESSWKNFKKFITCLFLSGENSTY